jgi:hypothetical protein
MKIVNGVRVHAIELSDRSLQTIHQLAMQAMAPHQALLDEIAPQLPQPPAPPQPAPSAPANGTAPPQDPPPPSDNGAPAA